MVGLYSCINSLVPLTSACDVSKSLRVCPGLQEDDPETKASALCVVTWPEFLSLGVILALYWGYIGVKLG